MASDAVANAPAVRKRAELGAASGIRRARVVREVDRIVPNIAVSQIARGASRGGLSHGHRFGGDSATSSATGVPPSLWRTSALHVTVAVTGGSENLDAATSSLLGAFALGHTEVQGIAPSARVRTGIAAAGSVCSSFTSLAKACGFGVRGSPGGVCPASHAESSGRGLAARPRARLSCGR